MPAEIAEALSKADLFEYYDAPQPAEQSSGVAQCTCPSGDGSLRWPCPKHPQPAPGLDELILALEEANHGHKAINSQNGAYYLALAKQARAALSRPDDTEQAGEDARDGRSGGRMTDQCPRCGGAGHTPASCPWNTRISGGNNMNNCNGDCNQGRNCDCGDHIRPARGVLVGVAISAVIWLLLWWALW
jgi:hypothetical protein